MPAERCGRRLAVAVACTKHDPDRSSMRSGDILRVGGQARFPCPVDGALLRSRVHLLSRRPVSRLRPDWRGSICFLVSGAIAYRASFRHGWLPVRDGAGWWQPGVNLLGCIFFGISAVAGYVVPSTGSMLDQAAANWSTAAGAACFLACALDTLHTGRATKMPLRRRLHRLEQGLEDEFRSTT
jgi:hypothetical protein